MRIVVAGGSGFVGHALSSALAARGGSVVVLSRKADALARRASGPVVLRAWDGRNPGPWEQDVDGADAVINLAGESVAGGRWTAERKLVLLKSRLEPTRALVGAIGRAAKRPRALVSASAVGFYGAAPAGDVAEDAPQGRDFLAALCGQWEREALAAAPLGPAVTLARFGVILHPSGGALKKMLPAFKLGAGGRLGSGRQPFPWVHLDDAVGAILALIEKPLPGPVNVVAPELVDNAAFAKALGLALHRPALLPAPAFALKLALGEMSSMLLEGQRAVPRKLERAGYAFRRPTLADALRDA